jgi:hypothetical protein
MRLSQLGVINMTDVEKIALWVGLIASIISIVLSVVAIIFARIVDKSSREVSAQTIKSLQKIESYVERLSSDTTGLIKAGWDRMLGSVGKPPNAEENVSAKEIAAGLLAEMRAELGLSETEQHDERHVSWERGEQLDDAFENIRSSLEAQLRTQTRSDRPSEALDQVLDILRGLSPQARALASLIASNRHLTFDQFQQLLKHSELAEAISELRAEGLLVPLEGVSRTGKAIPVYYFPPRLSDIVRAATLLLPEVADDLQKFVASELMKVGYQPR